MAIPDLTAGVAVQFVAGCAADKTRGAFVDR
jgi:hypothetical protein